MVVAPLVRRYPVVICDEHQVCSGDQHAIMMALHHRAACAFSAPLQWIYRETPLPGYKPPMEWGAWLRPQTCSRSSTLRPDGTVTGRSLAPGSPRARGAQSGLAASSALLLRGPREPRERCHDPACRNRLGSGGGVDELAIHAA
jgi:hypothetical protein